MNQEKGPQHFPTKEELLQGQNEVAGKIGESKKAKEDAIKEKIAELDLNLVSLKELDSYYEEAKKNLDFYEGLEQAHQLSLEDGTHLEDAKNLVEQVQALIDKKKEESEEIMQIPEVHEEIRKTADDQNKDFEKEKKMKEAELAIAEWVANVVREMKNLKNKIDEKQKPLKESREELIKILKDELGDESGKFSINGGLRSELEKYKNKLGLFKKGPAKAILKSKELSRYEECQKDLDSLGIEIKFHGGYENLQNLARYIFENSEEIKDKLNIINNISEEDENLSYRIKAAITSKLKTAGEEGASVEQYMRYLGK